MAVKRRRTKAILLAAALVQLSSVPGRAQYVERAVCGDSAISGRQLSLSSEAEHEQSAATFVIAGLVLNKSTFADVERKFGRSTPRSRSFDHAAIYECYKSSEWPKDSTIVTFVSSVASGFIELTGFELKSDLSADAQGCVTSDLVQKGMATDSGIRLRMTERDLQRTLGPGTPSVDSIRRWVSLVKVPADASEVKRSGESYYLRFSGVIARFRDSSADCLSVFQTETD